MIFSCFLCGFVEKRHFLRKMSKKNSYVEGFLSSQKQNNPTYFPVTNSDSFHTTARIKTCFCSEQGDAEQTCLQDFKQDLFKTQVEELGIVICNLSEGYLPENILVEKACRLDFLLNVLISYMEYGIYEFQALFDFFRDNDGLEEITALVYLAGSAAKRYNELYSFILERLGSDENAETRPYIIEALKWTDNEEVETCLKTMFSYKNQGIKAIVEQISAFRNGRQYPVKIPFYYRDHGNLET